MHAIMHAIIALLRPGQPASMRACMGAGACLRALDDDGVRREVDTPCQRRGTAQHPDQALQSTHRSTCRQRHVHLLATVRHCRLRRCVRHTCKCA